MDKEVNSLASSSPPPLNCGCEKLELVNCSEEVVHIVENSDNMTRFRKAESESRMLGLKRDAGSQSVARGDVEWR